MLTRVSAEEYNAVLREMANRSISKIALYSSAETRVSIEGVHRWISRSEEFDKLSVINDWNMPNATERRSRPASKRPRVDGRLVTGAVMNCRTIIVSLMGDHWLNRAV